MGKRWEMLMRVWAVGEFPRKQGVSVPQNPSLYMKWGGRAASPKRSAVADIHNMVYNMYIHYDTITHTHTYITMHFETAKTVVERTNRLGPPSYRGDKLWTKVIFRVRVSQRQRVILLG